VPSLRALGVAAIAGLAISASLRLWFHWPTTLAIGLGVLAAAVVLVTSVSFGHDPADADAAWRAAAPDLIDRSFGAATPGAATPGAATSGTARDTSVDAPSPETAIEKRT
jgi:hypothetical protein